MGTARDRDLRGRLLRRILLPERLRRETLVRIADVGRRGYHFAFLGYRAAALRITVCPISGAHKTPSACAAIAVSQYGRSRAISSLRRPCDRLILVCLCGCFRPIWWTFQLASSSNVMLYCSRRRTSQRVLGAANLIA